jgi:diguanylate cyclase (GGDEF)-like protein
MREDRADARTKLAVKRQQSRMAPRGRKPMQPKINAPKKSRSVAMRLAAEIDALKEELTAARMRLAELETRVDEDPLTGLLNRRGFVKALERALAYVRRYQATAALVFLDLDGFKTVNDRHGHAAGDWVLGRIGRLIAGSVRASDVVARVGGDEFVVLLWNLSEAQAAAKARSFEETVEASPFEQGECRYAIGLSAGLTILAAEDNGDTALARADLAMYARKRERKNS